MPRKKTPTNKRKTKTQSTASRVTASRVDTPQKQTVGIQSKVDNKVVVALLLLALLGVVAYFLYRQFMVSAYVNGEPISRLKLIKQLEKQYGASTLNQLVTEKLIAQEAKKRGISTTQADIDKEIKNIEKNVSQQNMTLDQALEAQGMTRAQLTEQIKLQVLVQKMVKTPAVSDEEVAKYVEENQELITPEKQAEEGFTAQIKEQLMQQKQQEAVQKFIADLESKAKITTVTKY